MSIHRPPLVAAALVAVLAGCATPAARLQPTMAPPPRADVAARVDSLVRDFMARNPLASISVAVSRGNETLVQRAWGMADVAAERPATEAMTYRIASVSKQFTAALLLKQVDRGKLSLSDSIGHHLTGLRPEWRPLTVEQLLNHTSGLQREFRHPSRMTEDLPTDTLIAWAARDTMAFAPGTRHAYSNVGYMLLGVLVEKLYGKPYGAALRDEFARPLGLRTLGWCTDTEKGTDAAKGATEVLGYVRPPQGEMQKATYLHTSQSLGSGGICVSAGDLAAWSRALHGGRVLSPASYTAMITPRGAAAAEAYAFGLRAEDTPWGTPVILHDGGTPGFAAQSAWYPAESLSVAVVYSGLRPPAVGGLLAQKLGPIALGIPLPAPAAPPSPAAQPVDSRLAGFAGEYQAGPGQTLAVTLENGQLFLLPPGHPRRPLTLETGTTFRIGGIPQVVTLTFTVGADGRTSAMVMRQGGEEQTLPRVR